MANEYVSVVDFKDEYAITDGIDDKAIARVVESVSRWVDAYCGRQFFPVTQTRYFTPKSCYVVDVQELVTVTTLKTDDNGDRVYETTWASTDYDLEPYNAALMSPAEPYQRVTVNALNGRYTFQPAIPRSVEIAGSWGMAAVPPTVKEATLKQAYRIFKRKDAPFAVLGGGNMGELSEIPQIDPDIKLMLMPFLSRW